jgi:hypothetical protein
MIVEGDITCATGGLVEVTNAIHTSLFVVALSECTTYGAKNI